MGARTYTQGQTDPTRGTRHKIGRNLLLEVKGAEGDFWRVPLCNIWSVLALGAGYTGIYISCKSTHCTHMKVYF